MRKLLYLCLAVLLTLGCTKDKVVTSPCDFQISLDWVKGSRVQFTITPSNSNATYTYGLLPNLYEQFNLSDSEKIDWQLQWMQDVYDWQVSQGKEVSYADMFCYKGARTIRNSDLEPDTDWQLLVFQINPLTREAIGPLYIRQFRTPPVPQIDLTFTIQHKDNVFRILPSDKTVTWFWEYEREDRVQDVFGSPFFFYYSVIGLYDEYGFLEHALCIGDDEWVLPQDDRSIKEGIVYNMIMSGCTTDGEICSEVLYANFIYEDGKVSFFYSDVPVEPIPD